MIKSKVIEVSEKLIEFPFIQETVSSREEKGAFPFKLLPFQSEGEMEKILHKCHSEIRNNDGHDPFDAFEEISKLMFAKIYDERFENPYMFRIYDNREDSETIAKRIRFLFEKARRKYDKENSIFSYGERLNLSDSTIAHIVKLLQNRTLVATDLDNKGRAFEVIVKEACRKYLGIYLTPQSVVKMTVEMLSPDEEEKIIDPACGTGGFLLQTLRYVRNQIVKKYTGRLSEKEIAIKLRDYADDNIWGIDINSKMTKTAKLNMLINEDGRTHIYTTDGLSSFSDLPFGIGKNKFDIVITNPPFGSYLSAKNPNFSSFDTAHNTNGSLKDRQSTEILFIERCLDLLKVNKRMAIVVPDSVLSNIGNSVTWSLLQKKSEILAIISLPWHTFVPTGATNKTSVLFLKKIEPSKMSNNSDVFMADIKHIGYDATNRFDPVNELPLVSRRFLEFLEGKRNFQEDFIYTIKEDKLQGNLCATVHKPYKSSIKSKKTEITLEEACLVIAPGKSPGNRKNYLDKPGIPILKVGNLTNQGIDWNPRERNFVSIDFFNKNPGAHLQINDLVLIKDAHAPMYIGRKIDIVEHIPQKYSLKCLAGGEIMILRPNIAVIEPYYLLLYLRSKEGYSRIQSCVRGQTAHLYKHDLGKIHVPLPSQNDPKLTKAITFLKLSLKTRRKYQSQIEKALYFFNQLNGEDRNC